MSGEAAWNVSSSRFSEEKYFSSFKAQLQRVCCMTLPKEGNFPEGSEARPEGRKEAAPSLR
jgi:hypothetical protein